LQDYLGRIVLGELKMNKNIKDKLSAAAIIALLSFLVLLHFMNEPLSIPASEQPVKINLVGQADKVDLQISDDDIIVNESGYILENVSIEVPITNLGTILADTSTVILYLEHDGNRTELNRTTINNLDAGDSTDVQFWWTIPVETEPGDYNLVVNAVDVSPGTDKNPRDNEAEKKIIINSIIEIETKKDFRYPGKKAKITTKLINLGNQRLNTTIDFYYYKESENRSVSVFIAQQNLDAKANGNNSITFNWTIPKDMETARYIIWANITDSSDLIYLNASANTLFKIIKQPDTTKTPVYMQIWFIVGLISLTIFFLTIIFSLIGVIPQDRLPIQPALVVMALVIMVIALIGNYLDPEVHLIGAQDIAGMVIIHPITALTAGFLVAGGLEAAGAFAAAADALGRIEKLKFKGKTIFGFTGTVVILTNIPTLIAMPCGRILGAALMPAALFFGYRVAKSTGDARMVGVVVFPFIVNAAASCGPSPLGGIGTIGEGLSKMPIGSFTAAQSTGIMICTGVCALFMRFITPMRPADLSDEDIRREREAEMKGAITEEDLKDVKYDPKKDSASGSGADAGDAAASDKASVALAKPVNDKDKNKDKGKEKENKKEESKPPMAKKVDDKT
jgi:hypothetical protein